MDDLHDTTIIDIIDGGGGNDEARSEWAARRKSCWGDCNIVDIIRDDDDDDIDSNGDNLKILSGFGAEDDFLGVALVEYIDKGSIFGLESRTYR